MPRLAPQFNGNGGPAVIEHRITLGTYERRELKKVVKAYNRDKWLENIPQMIGLGLLGGGFYYGMKYGGAAIGAGLDLAKDAGEFIEDTYNDLNNAVRNLDPAGQPMTVSTTNLEGDETEINVPFTGTVLGGVSREIVKGIVWLPNPLTGEVPFTIPWYYRQYRTR